MKGKKYRARVKQIYPYVREIADLMKLKDWEIIIEDEVAPDDVNGRIKPIFGRYIGRIQLGPNFFEETAENQRHTIVHELHHLHYATLTNALLPNMEGALKDFFTQAVEYGVDVAADLISLSMPLPPKIK